MEALHDFLKLTKHLVTDHAAFMFLTNRDHYEKLISLEQLKRTGHIMTNPLFKTFYNHVSSRFTENPALIANIWFEWSIEERSRRRSVTVSSLASGAWGTVLVYRARMVPFDFNRRLKALVEADGEFLYQNSTLLLSRSIYRQEITMQLAIEAITRAPDVMERIDETPILGQYIYDTPYLPSFYHERGLREVTRRRQHARFRATRDDLRDHLWYRSGGSSDNGRKSEAPERQAGGECRAPNGKKPTANADPPKGGRRPASREARRNWTAWRQFAPGRWFTNGKPGGDRPETSRETIDYLFAILKRYFELLAKPVGIQEATNQVCKRTTVRETSTLVRLSRSNPNRATGKF